MVTIIWSDHGLEFTWTDGRRQYHPMASITLQHREYRTTICNVEFLDNKGQIYLKTRDRLERYNRSAVLGFAAVPTDCDPVTVVQTN